MLPALPSLIASAQEMAEELRRTLRIDEVSLQALPPFTIQMCRKFDALLMKKALKSYGSSLIQCVD